MTSTTDEPSRATDAAGSPKSIKSAGSRAGTRSPQASGHGSPAGAAGADDAVEAEETHPELEAESDLGSDTASNYASDVSDTSSATSSIFDYEYENGRRYHAYRAGQYLLPNDETEQERLDMTHHVVPPNVRFEIDDATLEWTFPKNHFDFIHARTLAGAVQNWPALIHQCYEHVKPGGSIEISEGRANFFCEDDTLKGDSATWQWLSEFRKLSAPLGFDIAPALPDMLKREGFENVNYMQRVVPMGTWPKDRELKEIGRWFRVQFLEMALEAYTLALFTRAGNWKNEEVQVLLALVREELKSDKIHLYTYT
ncbi:hypothetical protein N0V92_002062 [Colletotrichum tropicale]|nr:hypothetical protein N0V92_002062 [Colletotrichum tropicale]